MNVFTGIIGIFFSFNATQILSFRFSYLQNYSMQVYYLVQFSPNPQFTSSKIQGYGVCLSADHLIWRDLIKGILVIQPIIEEGSGSNLLTIHQLILHWSFAIQAQNTLQESFDFTELPQMISYRLPSLFHPTQICSSRGRSAENMRTFLFLHCHFRHKRRNVAVQSPNLTVNAVVLGRLSKIA